MDLRSCIEPLSAFSRSPAEYYIKYFLTYDLHADLDEVQKRLVAYKILLPANPLVYLRQLAEDLELHLPSPFQPADPANIPTQEFLLKHGVWALWHPDQSTRDAQAIHQLPAAREAVQGMLSAGIHRRDIIATLSPKCAFLVTGKAIDCYSKYFWNLELLTVDERESMYQDHSVASTVRVSARHSRSLGGRAAVLSLFGNELPVLDKRRTFEELFTRGAAGMACVDDVHDPLEQAQTLVSYGQAMMMAHKGLIDVRQQQQEDLSGQPATADFGTRRLERSTLTMQQLQTPGMQPPRLPGRGATSLTVIEGDYKEVKKDGPKAG